MKVLWSSYMMRNLRAEYKGFNAKQMCYVFCLLFTFLFTSHLAIAHTYDNEEHIAYEYCQHCAQYTPFDNNNCGSTVSQKLLRKQPPSPILFLRDLHPSSFFTKIEIRGPPRI